MKLLIYLSYINCSIVLFSLISVIFLPDKKFYEKNHFIDILKIKYINFDMDYKINISDANTFRNYTFIISEVEHQINSSKIINVIISVFSSIHLSLAFWSFFKDYISFSKKINIFYNTCLLLLSSLIFIMALIILIKINKITKEYDYDDIGLTSEIKSRIIMIIIMMCFDIVIIILNYFMLKKKDKIMKIISEEVGIKLLKEVDKKFKEKEIFEENKKIKEKEEYKKLKEENKKSKENEKLKEENEKLKEENEKLKEENKKLKEENKKLKEENKKNKEENEKFEEENKKLKKENKILKELSKKNEESISGIDIKKEVEQNKNINKEIAIIFISGDQKMNYPMICQESVKFAIYEQKLYDLFPKYKESDNYFICNGKKINRNYTMEENKIKYGDIIQINIIEC